MSKLELTQSLGIEKELFDTLQNILNIECFDESFEKTDQCLFEKGVLFEDGICCMFSVRTGQHNAWVESAWFDANGMLLAESEPDFELESECFYQTSLATYSVLVQEK